MKDSLQTPGRAREVDTVIRGELLNRTLYVDVRYPDECATLWKTGRFTQLGITDYENPDLSDTRFLDGFPAVNRIHLRLGKKVDLSPLRLHAESLISFFANDGVNGIDDFRPFEVLEEVGQIWFRTTVWREDMSSLRRLSLTSYKPVSRDLSELPNAPQLASLSLFRPSIDRLGGLARYGSLRSLSIDSAPQLYDVSELRSMVSIAELGIEKCRKVQGLVNAIEGLALRKLACVDSAALPTISFINRMPDLESFVFMGADVDDGNMCPLISHPSLTHFAFTRKKHFSHSEDDIRAARKASGGTPSLA